MPSITYLLADVSQLHAHLNALFTVEAEQLAEQTCFLSLMPMGRDKSRPYRSKRGCRGEIYPALTLGNNVHRNF